MSSPAYPDGHLLTAGVASQTQEKSMKMSNATSAIEGLADQVMPMVEQASADVSDFAHRSVDSMRYQSQRLRDQANHASDVTVHYIRREPVRAVLMAAAFGATLAALFNLIRASRKS